MRIFCFMIFFGCYSISSIAQSDLLILKKNNRTIKSFYPGSEIMFSTDLRHYDAYVTSIERDSVFLVQYDIRQVPTNLGVYVLDTIARYYSGVNYKDIVSFGKSRNNFNWDASGAALFGGGVLLTTAGLVTWIFAKPNTRYYARPGLVIGAATLAGIGYLLMKTGNKNMPLGKKYSLQYINVH